MYLDAKSFVAKYVNQRNPATRMYWRTEDAAKDAGIPLELAEAYVISIQLDNAYKNRIMSLEMALESSKEQVFPILEKYRDEIGLVKLSS